jgi:hypothetical protein
MASDAAPKKKPPADDAGSKSKSGPKSKPSSPSSRPSGGGPPPAGPDPMAGGGGAPPMGDPMNALPFPPVSGPPMGGPDPMAAMGGMGGGPPDLAALLGLGGMGGGPPMGGGGMGGPPPGPQLPIGGSMPGGGDADMAGSPLLAMLASSLSDPYAVTGAPVDLNVGPADPQMGLQGLLQLLCNAKLGTGGANASAGMSGVPMDMGQVGGGLY